MTQSTGPTLHVEQQGQQPHAIFLHGFGGDVHTWDLLWNQWGSPLDALRFDLRGYGRSGDDQDIPFSHADDLLSVVNKSGLQQVDLVGVSKGGSIALNFTLDHPDRVRTLVLLSPGLVAWEWSPEWRRDWQAIVAEARHGSMERARQLWWEHPLFATTRTSAAAAMLRESIGRFSGAQWIRDHQRPLLPDIERLHQLATPTLLLSGGRDVADFRLIAALIAASSASVERVDVAECGHLIQLEEPATCARLIQEFWERQGASES